jgi:hypothetical protein
VFWETCFDCLHGPIDSGIAPAVHARKFMRAISGTMVLIWTLVRLRQTLKEKNALNVALWRKVSHFSAGSVLGILKESQALQSDS